MDRKALEDALAFAEERLRVERLPTFRYTTQLGGGAVVQEIPPVTDHWETIVQVLRDRLAAVGSHG